MSLISLKFVLLAVLSIVLSTLTHAFIFTSIRESPTFVNARASRWTSSRLTALSTTSEPISGRESSLQLPSRVAVCAAPVLAALVGKAQAALAATSGNRKMQYLTEPTAEFNNELAKVAAFNAEQAKIRKAWDDIVTRFEKSEAPEDLEATLKEMIAFLKKLDGVPTGYTKRDLVKTCRAKKFAGGKKPTKNWVTKVEIQYQALIQAWNKQMSPENSLPGDRNM